MSGYVSYRAGLAAEDGVETHYRQSGHTTAARRWRCAAGEIDLIMRADETVVFVEVKRAKDFDRAVARLGAHQFDRIFRAASVFLGTEPKGQDTDTRFDVALVNELGEMQVIENAYMT